MSPESDAGHELMQIAERLVTDFSDQVPLTTVINVLRDCTAENPSSSSELVEQMVRIQLQIRNQGHSQ